MATMAIDHGSTHFSASEAWRAVERQNIRRQRIVEGVQRFDDYAQLEAKLAPQGPASRARIAECRGPGVISIPMPYRMALL